MNLANSMALWLEAEGFASIGEDLFIGQAPSSNKVPDSVWWIVAVGGTPQRNVTGESRNTYSVQIFYRDRNYRNVYDCMHRLEKLLNCMECVKLCDFETISVSAEVLMVDQDLDSEDRKLGIIQAQIGVFDFCGVGVEPEILS